MSFRQISRAFIKVYAPASRNPAFKRFNCIEQGPYMNYMNRDLYYRQSRGYKYLISFFLLTSFLVSGKPKKANKKLKLKLNKLKNKLNLRLRPRPRPKNKPKRLKFLNNLMSFWKTLPLKTKRRSMLCG